MVKKLFFYEIFWNLWRIDTLTLSIQYLKFYCPTLPCCRGTLPQGFKNSTKGDPREIFCSVQNLNSFWNHLIWWQFFCTFHFWKPFCAAAYDFLTVHYLTQVTYGLKKHAIQHGQIIFSVMKPFETYGGLTPSTCQFSIKVSLSYAALQLRNAASRFWKFSKRGTPGKLFARFKFKLFPKRSHLMTNFMFISYLKTVLCCCVWFSHSALFNTGHFWTKKTCHTTWSKNFPVMKSCETYGGLTLSTYQFSM